MLDLFDPRIAQRITADRSAWPAAGVESRRSASADPVTVLDRTLGEKMNRVFLDDLRHSQEITREAFRARSWRQRVAERGANWLTRLL